MGMAASASLTMKMIVQFRPRFVAMVGIAAGVKGNYGDVLVASHCWDYGSGKHVRPTGKKGGLFQPAPSQLDLDPLMQARIQLFAMKEAIPRDVHGRWRGEGGGSNPFAVKIGPLASGAAVVADRAIVESILGHNRKLIGLEMETYGVYMAARLCPTPRPFVISMKAVCDFGDSSKGDDYQAYAAFTSAQYMFEFALDQLA